VIRTLASTENPLFSQASMSAAAAASSRRVSLKKADHAAADSLGQCGQVCGGDWPDRQERRRCVTPCRVSSRHEDAVGDAGVEMHVVVERRAKAVQEGDAAVPRAG
jgi:hypothetical protein